MRELKTLFVVLFFVGLLYWGIEPFAHTKLHPHVDPPNYDFAAEDIALAKTNVQKATENLAKIEKTGDKTMIHNAQKSLELTKNSQDKYTIFWNEINKIDLKTGDATRGAESFVNAGCTACHGVEAAGMPAPMDNMSASEAYGVAPPDLSTAGHLYTDKFLAAVIKDPTMALKLSHKFGDEVPFPMPGFSGLGGDLNQELADIVAYLKSIAPKKVSNEQLFKDACQRCHDMKYDNKFTLGNKQSLAHYMGSTPPDLSMMIRSRQAGFLHEFINDTQKMLPGTSMPRVGLNENTEKQIVAYIQKVGDGKKDEREKTSLYIMLYFAILSVFATLWKIKIWRKLH